MEVETMPKRYEIEQQEDYENDEENWRLRLYEDEVEMGGGRYEGDEGYNDAVEEGENWIADDEGDDW
jgi:hypothetical protein